MVRYVEQREDDKATLKWDIDDPAAAVLTSHFDSASSPALERLNELAEEKRASRSGSG